MVRSSTQPFQRGHQDGNDELHILRAYRWCASSLIQAQDLMETRVACNVDAQPQGSEKAEASATANHDTPQDSSGVVHKASHKIVKENAK